MGDLLHEKCPEIGCGFGGTTAQVLEHKFKMDQHNLHESQISDNPQPFCIGCIRVPEEIAEYRQDRTGSSLSPTEFVKREEGTYNRKNGHFLCTTCYIMAGSPSGPNGWKAP